MLDFFRVSNEGAKLLNIEYIDVAELTVSVIKLVAEVPSKNSRWGNGFWGVHLTEDSYYLQDSTFGNPKISYNCNPYHTYCIEIGRVKGVLPNIPWDAARISRCKFWKLAAFRQSSPFWSPVLGRGCESCSNDIKSRKTWLFSCRFGEDAHFWWMAAVVLWTICPLCPCFSVLLSMQDFFQISVQRQAANAAAQTSPGRVRARTFQTPQVCIPQSCVMWPMEIEALMLQAVVPPDVYGAEALVMLKNVCHCVVAF